MGDPFARFASAMSKGKTEKLKEIGNDGQEKQECMEERVVVQNFDFCQPIGYLKKLLEPVFRCSLVDHDMRLHDELLDPGLSLPGQGVKIDGTVELGAQVISNEGQSQLKLDIKNNKEVAPATPTSEIPTSALSASNTTWLTGTHDYQDMLLTPEKIIIIFVCFLALCLCILGFLYARRKGICRKDYRGNLLIPCCSP